jgi:protein MpaA
MKSVIESLALCISVLALFACASGHHAPFTGEPALVRKINAIEKRLEKAVSASPFLSMEVIGTVTYDNFQAPVRALTFNFHRDNGRKVLISAGVHGNEPAGVNCAVRLAESLAKYPEKYKNDVYDIIAVVNPWGWSYDIRYNRHGIDINRDFASFKSQEAKFIREFVKGKKYDLMIDLHEDPTAEGFYLYQYGHPDKATAKQIIAKIKMMGYPTQQNVSMIILKTKDGIIDAPMWGLWYMKLTRQLSIANFYRLNHSKKVFTLETPTRLPMEDRLKMQTIAVDMLLNGWLP